ncbi:hypothetical protein Trihar35433_833 [Trichoderma harzianum]|nr:hypothetical protein Trihar35433_833 [Trichoderma harzianum]
MSDETWMGCTVQQKSDGGCIILSPDSIPLLETEDAPKTMSKKDDHGNPVDSIRDDEFAKFELLARCTFLSDSCDEDDNTKTNASRLEKLSRLEQELKGMTVNGKTYVSAAYLGFSMEMKGPVFMRRELRSARNSEKFVRLPVPLSMPGWVHKHAAHFNLEGVMLQCGLSSSSPTINPRDVILHHLAMTEANLVMLKRLVSGEPLETFLTTPEDRQAYDLYVEKLIQGLKKGAAIAPFSFINPPVLSDVPPGSNSSGSLQADAKPRGDDNRHLSKVTCKPDLATQTVSPKAFTGFKYYAAPAGAFEYPPELIRLLKEFALQYPNDFLPLRLMFLACHLWFDIITHPDLQLEWFMLRRKEDGRGFNEVPNVSLAAFIVYFAHWLSWTESMGLSEYPHPFRFVYKAYELDQVHSGFTVNMDHIPQDRVMASMRKVTSRIPNVSIDKRIVVIPSRVPGTKMPPMHHWSFVKRPHRISLALTGLPHLGYLGLRNYTRQDVNNTAEHLEKRFRVYRLPYFVNSSLFANFGTRLQVPSDLSKGILKTFLRISPFWKPNILWNDLKPSHQPPAPPVHSSQQTGTGSPATRPQARRQSLLYMPLLESWSKVPQRAHWAWKHALQLLKDLPEEEQQEETFKELISTAQAKHNGDIDIVNDCLSSLYTMEDLSDHDLYTALPTALVKLIGLPPPQIWDGDVWAEYFPTIDEPSSPQVNCISMILGYFRSAKANPSSIPHLRPLIQRTAQQLMGMSNSLETRDWLGSQWDFLFPQFTSTCNTAGDYL